MIAAVVARAALGGNAASSEVSSDSSDSSDENDDDEEEGEEEGVRARRVRRRERRRVLQEIDETGDCGGWEPPGIVAPILRRGDAILYDQRTVHRGTANLSTETRPVLYLLFARPWYEETLNFGKGRLFSAAPPRSSGRRHGAP